MDEFNSSQYTSEVRTPEDKYKVGASAHIAEKEGEYALEITESLENERITARSKGKFAYTMTYVLKSVENGTRLTCAMNYEMPWGILGRTLDKLFGRKHAEEGIEKSLKNLKHILEKEMPARRPTTVG